MNRIFQRVQRARNSQATSNLQQPRSRQKLRFEALEKRMLLAGDLASQETQELQPTAFELANGSRNQQQSYNADAASLETSLPPTIDQAHSETTLVFIDSGVHDDAAIIESITRQFSKSARQNNFQIVKLDIDQDPFASITDVISEQSDVSSLHIVSHGSSGRLYLGGKNVDAQYLDSQQERLHQWNAFLSQDADIILYGCDVAAGQAGISFTNRLASLTMRDVTASTNPTGNSGDWILEHRTGQIESATLTMPLTYKGTLGKVSFTANHLTIDASDGVKNHNLRLSVLNNQLSITDPSFGDLVAGTGVTDLDSTDHSVTVAWPIHNLSWLDIDGIENVMIANSINLGDASLEIDAEEIEVHAGSVVETTGNVTLHASDDLSPLSNANIIDLSVTEASITLTNAEIKAAAVTLNANANSSDLFTDSSTASEIAESATDFLSSISLIGGFAKSKAQATIDLLGSTKITAEELTIHADAATEARVLTTTFFLGVAVGISDPTATITIGSGTDLSTSGNMDIRTRADSVLDVAAKQGLMGPSRSGENINITAAYGYSDITSKIDIQNSASLTSGGSISLKAQQDKSSNVKAAAAAFDDGSLGLSFAMSELDSKVDTIVSGTLHAVGDINIEAEANTTRNDLTAQAGVGNGIGAKLAKYNIAQRPISALFQSVVPISKVSQTPTKFALSASFAYARHQTDTNAYLSANATVVSLSGSVSINALTVDVPEISAISTVDSTDLFSFDKNNSQYKKTKNPGKVKENSAAGAVSVGDYVNNTRAYAAENSSIDATGDTKVQAITRLPYEIQWLQINEVADVLDKANSNGGIQNGFFTSWSQTNSQGSERAFSASVNYLNFTNLADAYLADNVQVNAQREFTPSDDIIAVESLIAFTKDHRFMHAQPVIYRNGTETADADQSGLQNGSTYYVHVVDAKKIKLAVSKEELAAGNFLTDLTVEGVPTDSHSLTPELHGRLTVEAFNEIDAVHFSGVLGFSTFSGGAASGGKTGIGGSYLDVTYKNTTKSTINTGVDVNASSLVVRADTSANNISITASGSSGSSGSFNGTLGLIDVDNTTKATIDDGAKIRTGSDEIALAKDIRDLYSPSLDIAFAATAVENDQVKFISPHDLIDGTRVIYRPMGNSALNGLDSGKEYTIKKINDLTIELLDSSNAKVSFSKGNVESTLHRFIYSAGNALLFSSLGNLSSERENVPLSLDSDGDGRDHICRQTYHQC